MKILTAAEMREVDRRTVELGIPDAVLMENAGHRVVEFLERRFAPLSAQRIVVICGKGNNGGDGVVVARQLATRFRPESLDVVLAGEGPANVGQLAAVGCAASPGITGRMRAATIVVDALLGTGLSGPPRGEYAALIAEINTGFPGAKVVAVDIPSGLASDGASTAEAHVRAHHTVTFTAPKLGQVLEPNASACGELVVGLIGSVDALLPGTTRLTTPAEIAPLFRKRAASAHKGDFGHVLVVGGAPGKTGAAAMAGLAALRAGAGLVTVCSSSPAAYPELMWEPLETLTAAMVGKDVVAIGPGLGISETVRGLAAAATGPMVIDADGLNSLAGSEIPPNANLILTPHPGEMSRLTGEPTAAIQANRLAIARAFAAAKGVTLVLKGRNTLTAFPDGALWINPTGGPAMATGGSGDILTGLIAGLVAQFPAEVHRAVVAAVWLHGRAGDLAAAEMGEKAVIATDLLRFLPAAMEECARVSH